MTDFEYTDLLLRSDRASGAYFAASKLLLLVRMELAASREEAQRLVDSLRDEYHALRDQRLAELAKRVERERAAQVAERQHRALEDERFRAACEAQRQGLGKLQAA